MRVRLLKRLNGSEHYQPARARGRVMLAAEQAASSDRRDAIYFNIEAAIPGGNVDKNAGRRVVRKEFSVYFVHLWKHIDVRDIDVDLEDVVEG